MLQKTHKGKNWLCVPSLIRRRTDLPARAAQILDREEPSRGTWIVVLRPIHGSVPDPSFSRSGTHCSVTLQISLHLQFEILAPTKFEEPNLWRGDAACRSSPWGAFSISVESSTCLKVLLMLIFYFFLRADKGGWLTWDDHLTNSLSLSRGYGSA